MEEIEHALTSPGVIKALIDVDGFILFEATKLASGGEMLRETERSTDIVTITNLADRSARAWPGIKFYLYSGVTGKWYAYFKPIQGV